MTNESKYRKNRNNWGKVYPTKRTKPSTIEFIDASGETITFDKSRYVRERDYFQLYVPVSGTAITSAPEPPAPPGPFPPWVNCPSGYMYNATETTDIVELGSGVDTWSEYSGGLPFGQHTDASRPHYSASRWVTFLGNQYMELSGSGAAGAFDFLFQSGGTVIFFVQTTGSMPVTTSKYLYGTLFAINLRGTEMRMLCPTTSRVQFGFLIGQPFFQREKLSKGYDNTVSGANYVVIGRFVSGTVSGVSVTNEISLRVNGEENTTTTAAWTGWTTATSVAQPKLGAQDNLSNKFNGAISIAIFCPTILTDAQCEDIETWAEANYDVLLSSSM